MTLLLWLVLAGFLVIALFVAYQWGKFDAQRRSNRIEVLREIWGDEDDAP